MAEPGKGERMVYHTAPAPDRQWEPPRRTDGTQLAGGQWRGPPLQPWQVPRGPKLNFGSRVGASAQAKGVYFGRPGARPGPTLAQ